MEKKSEGAEKERKEEGKEKNRESVGERWRERERIKEDFHFNCNFLKIL